MVWYLELSNLSFSSVFLRNLKIFSNEQSLIKQLLKVLREHLELSEIFNGQSVHARTEMVYLCGSISYESQVGELLKLHSRYLQETLERLQKARYHC